MRRVTISISSEEADWGIRSLEERYRLRHSDMISMLVMDKISLGGPASTREPLPGLLRNYRRRKKLEIWLSEEAHRILAMLAEQSGYEKSDMIRRLIKERFEQVFAGSLSIERKVHKREQYTPGLRANLTAWLCEKCELTPARSTSFKELYESYKAHHSLRGVPCYSFSQFGKVLAEAGIPKWTVWDSKNKKTVVVRLGIGLIG